MRGAGKVYGLQTGAPGGSGREADGGDGGACVSRNWGPTPCATAGHFDYTVDRNGDGLQAGRNRGTGAVCPRTENVPAHGWGANLECGGGAGAQPAASDARSGSGCAFVWRDEERVNGCGGGGVLSSGTSGEFLVCAQAGDAAGFEDAVHGGADGSAADERSLAAEREACERDGATAGTGSEEDSASQDCVSGRGERRVCASSP